jgi:hypothetical protein
VLFDALGLSGSPPTQPIEFDALLKDALSERFRVLVCDEAQWLSRESFELWRHLWDDRRTDIAIMMMVSGGQGSALPGVGSGVETLGESVACRVAGRHGEVAIAPPARAPR